MDIRSLQQVIAIRKHGSFTKAAAALGVSQPNLSNSVARLEDELKLQIFDRTAKGSALTPIGEMILARADAVIAETRDLARDAALLAGGETGSVRIGGGPALMTPLMTPLMHGLARGHPGLQIHGETARAPDCRRFGRPRTRHCLCGKCAHVLRRRLRGRVDP